MDYCTWVADLERVGTCVLYKFDGKLFRRSTIGAHQAQIIECQFADDVALLVTTRSGAEKAALRGQAHEG